jgi:outer membrane receptor protein involved in Fe transport
MNLLPAAVWAQASLEITVFSAVSGQPVPALPLTVTNPSIGFSTAQTTDDQGKVRLYSLATSGDYVVQTGESEDYFAYASGAIRLRSNGQSSVSLLLNRKTTVDLGEVVVRGTSVAQLNTINAEVSSELTSREIGTLPIEGRDITRALYRLPNVTQATGFYPEAPNVSINGANSLYTNYLIDGLDNNENFLGGMKFNIPVGFTQNISVLTSNYSAEYGWTGNGVFNITSKSGSNATTGEAFYLVRPGPAIDAPSRYAQRDLSGNQVKDGFQRHQAGFGVGGALRKDRTFYYVNAEQTVDLKDNLLRVPQLGLNETVRGVNRFTYLSGKIDHHVTDRLRSSLRVNAGLVNIQQPGGGLEGGATFPSAGYSQDRNSLLVAWQNSYRGVGFTSETNLQYARFRWNYSRPRNPDSPNVTVLDPAEQTVAVLGHPGFVFDDVENTYQLQQKFTFVRDRHTIKTGVNVISSGHLLSGGGNPNGSYLVKLNEGQLATLRGAGRGADLTVTDIPAGVEVLNYSVELRPASFGTRQNRYSLYVEDLFSVTDRLNLTLGLRYDYDNLSRGGAKRGDYNNVSPRFNFNYKLGDRSTVRGGYGIFYDKILYAIYSDALQQNTTSARYRGQLQTLIDRGILPSDTDLDRITFNGNLSATVAGATYPNGPRPAELQGQRETVSSNELRILNPGGYQNPYTHQFALGYQYQVAAGTLFYADLLHTQSYNLFRLRDLNAPAPYPLDNPATATVRRQEDADATRPVPNGAARNVMMTETAGRSRYYALNVNLVKERGEEPLAYRLSYTLSRLENNTEDINFRAQDANNFEAEWGPSINDRTHVINALLYYFPVKNLSVNLAALLQSGQPINRTPTPRTVRDSNGQLVLGPGGEAVFTTDLNGDGRSFGDAYVGNSDREPGESRNNDRLPWAATFDLGVQYTFRFGGDGGNGLELRADVFNLLNAENLSGYSNNATQSNQVQVGPRSSGVLVRRNAAPPRQFQFGVRYVF